MHFLRKYMSATKPVFRKNNNFSDNIATVYACYAEKQYVIVSQKEVIS